MKTVAIQTRRRRGWLRRTRTAGDGGSGTDVAAQDNRLDFLDQASFLSLRATGREQLMQGIWIYEHPIDMDGVRRFHENLGYGLGGRLIERSPLPFGRHRWVSNLGPRSPLDISEPRPRSALSDWIDERSQLRVDPELGPGWHIGVLPMTDGSTAVSVVTSHTLGDGGAGILTAVEAVLGNRRDIGYPARGSRTRWQGIMADTRGMVRDAPVTGRALVGAAKLIGRSLRDRSADKTPAAPKLPDTGEMVLMPAINAVIDAGEWDACAAERGGNTYSLLAGVSARLGAMMGRVKADTGEVLLMIALSDRTLEDTRGHAMQFVTVPIDPDDVLTDQTTARAGIRTALKKLKEKGEQAVDEDAFKLLALTPFTPKRAVRGAGNLAFGFDALPVACSNMGDLFTEYARIDGTDAEYVLGRGVDQGVSRADIERGNGQLVLVAWRIGGKVAIGIVAYQVGAENTKDWLRGLTVKALDEFGLTATII